MLKACVMVLLGPANNGAYTQLLNSIVNVERAAVQFGSLFATYSGLEAVYVIVPAPEERYESLPFTGPTRLSSKA